MLAHTDGYGPRATGYGDGLWGEACQPGHAGLTSPAPRGNIPTHEAPMTLRHVISGAALMVLVAVPLQAADDCSRACLRTTLDQYLTAIAKHDPTAAPLFAGYRHTENAVVKKLGTGVWQTVTALGRLQRRYVDPVTGQAAFFGLVNEGSGEAI